jgi:DNA modification methylase
MGRHRTYATDAERQAAYRSRQARAVLSQIPVVHGEHYTLYQGDALRIVPLLSGYDHCITDPPYEQEAHTRTRRTRAVLEGRAPYADIAFAPITEAQRRFLAGLCCQWLLIFCQAEAVGQYAAVLGPKYKRPAVWRKRDGAPQMSGDRPGMGYESIVCAWCQPGRARWNRGGKRGWYDQATDTDLVYDYLVRDKQPRLHATQKPLALMKELLLDFTQPGDVVLDPFMGSGTTGVACLEYGRRFVGIELDPGYFQLACQRLAQSAAQGRLFAEAPPAAQARLF